MGFSPLDHFWRAQVSAQNKIFGILGHTWARQILVTWGFPEKILQNAAQTR